jgi:hypothetical protein
LSAREFATARATFPAVSPLKTLDDGRGGRESRDDSRVVAGTEDSAFRSGSDVDIAGRTFVESRDGVFVSVGSVGTSPAASDADSRSCGARVDGGATGSKPERTFEADVSAAGTSAPWAGDCVDFGARPSALGSSFFFPLERLGFAVFDSARAALGVEVSLLREDGFFVADMARHSARRVASP